jgi:hypothetical protein
MIMPAKPTAQPFIGSAMLTPCSPPPRLAK